MRYEKQQEIMKFLSVAITNIAKARQIFRDHGMFPEELRQAQKLLNAARDALEDVNI